MQRPESDTLSLGGRILDRNLQELGFVTLGYYQQNPGSFERRLESLGQQFQARGIDYKKLNLRDNLDRVAQEVVRAKIETTQEHQGPVFTHLADGAVLRAFKLDDSKAQNRAFQADPRYSIIVKMPHFEKTRPGQLPPDTAQLGTGVKLPQNLQNGYFLIKNVLGPKLTAAIILEDVSVDIDGKVRTYPYVFVQQQVKTYEEIELELDQSLGRLQRDLARAKSAQARSAVQEEIDVLKQERKILDEDIIKLRREMAESGVFDLDLANWKNNYGRVMARITAWW